MSATSEKLAGNELTEQYNTDQNLRVRIQMHERYSVGPKMEPAIDETLALKGDEELLDVGCGPGDFVGRLRGSGHRGRLAGVDHSAGMIGQASAKHAGVEFSVADAQQFAFADKSFDVVTARHMLYHVPDAGRAVREMFRVLRAGGHFLAVTNATGFMREYYEAIGEAVGRVAGAKGEARAEIGKVVTTPVSENFSEVNGGAIIREVFGEVKIQILDSVLVFDALEPVMGYFDSTQTMKAVDPAVWARLREGFADVVGGKLKRGEWRVQKRIALLSAWRR